MTSTKKIKNPSTSQTSQHLVAANVWSCPFKRSRWVWVCLSFYSTFPFHAVKCDVSVPGSDSSVLPCHAFCQDGVDGVWAWGPTRVRRSPDEANVSPRPLFGSLLWVLLHADGCFGPYCFTGKHSRPPLCQSTDSTNKTPQVLLVVCCNPVQLWFHLPAPPVNRHFFPS